MSHLGSKVQHLHQNSLAEGVVLGVVQLGLLSQVLLIELSMKLEPLLVLHFTLLSKLL